MTKAERLTTKAIQPSGEGLRRDSKMCEDEIHSSTLCPSTVDSMVNPSSRPLRPLPMNASSGLTASQHAHQQKTAGQGSRGILLLLIVTVLLVGLAGRLAYLQVVDNAYYRQLADTNRIRLVPRPPERGRILDRHGALLAGSQLSHAVYLWPLAQSRAAWQLMIPRLALLLDIPAEEIETRLQQAGYRSPFPVRVLRNVDPNMVIRLQELNRELPGVIVEAEAIRYYPNGDLAAHVLGYTAEISNDQLLARPEANYRLGDIIGQMGVEGLFESSLRGQWGGQQVEVDAGGEVLRVLGEQAPQAGQTVRLTLDAGLQRTAEQVLAERRGAVVAIDPRNGEILAMASYPVFDPNIFSNQITQAQWDAIQRQAFPFLNRAIRAYAPASTFKIVTTSAALEDGGYAPTTVLGTAPYIQVGGRRFWDWNRAGFGTLGFEQAMAYSSDTFFYQVALNITAGPIQEWSRRYGLGSQTGLNLTGESAGLVPDQEWKLANWREPWYVGDTVNMSIGQGFLMATPLQQAVMASVVANGGWRVTPILSEQTLAGREPQREWVGLSPSTLDVLRRGLRGVVVYGTGGNGNLGEGYPPAAGKTGTAEDQPRLSHAWYVGYAPYENPEIVVATFLENSGGGGGTMAAPMARDVLRAYFDLQRE